MPVTPHLGLRSHKLLPIHTGILTGLIFVGFSACSHRQFTHPTALSEQETLFHHNSIEIVDYFTIIPLRSIHTMKPEVGNRET